MGRLTEAQRRMLNKLVHSGGACDWHALASDGRSRRTLNALKDAGLITTQGSWPSGSEGVPFAMVEITDAGRRRALSRSEEA